MNEDYEKDKKKAEKILRRIHAIEEKVDEADISIDTLNKYFSTEHLCWAWDGSNLAMWKALRLRVVDELTKNIPPKLKDEGQRGHWHGQWGYSYEFATLSEILEISEEELDRLEASIESLKKGD